MTFFRLIMPALAAQKHMHAPTAVTHAHLTDLLDPMFQLRLPRPAGFCMWQVEVPKQEHTTRPPE